MSYRPNAGQTTANLQATSALLGTQLIPTSDSSGNLTKTTLTQLLAWLLANDGSADLATATLLSSVPSGLILFGVQSDGTLVRVPLNLLGTSSGGTAPSQVGSLTAGTPTSTTIPVTYTAATGTATIAYAGQTSPHGANTWSANGGTFTSTGGTFTGLTPSTSYDLRIIATNGAGSSTTTLTTGVSAAAGGGSYPSITFSGSPTFESASPIWGAKSLKGGAGAGTVTIPIPANANGSGQAGVGIKLWFRGAAGTTSNSSPWLTLTPASGADVRFQMAGASVQASVGGSTFVGPGTSVRDGTRHFLYIRVDSNYNVTYSAIYIDGNAANPTNGGATAIQTGSATLTLNLAQLLSTDIIDNIEVTTDVGFGATVPTAATTRTSATLGLFDFDAGDGTGS